MHQALKRAAFTTPASLPAPTDFGQRAALITRNQVPGDIRKHRGALRPASATGSRLDRRKMEYSYRAGDDFVFTDPETYEPETIIPELVGDAVDYMVENCEVEITFIEGNPAMLELPSSVVLTVTDAPEGVKGDSTTNVMKTVTLETGKKIQAPLFIKNGERLKIDTREGKYMERVNK